MGAGDTFRNIFMPGDYALRLSGGLTPLLEAPAAVNEQPP